MERKKTLTWRGLGDDDDDTFFESFEATNSGASSSSDDDEEFLDSRMSFSARSRRFSILSRKESTAAVTFAIPEFEDDDGGGARAGAPPLPPSKSIAARSQRFRIMSRKGSTAAIAVPVPDIEDDGGGGDRAASAQVPPSVSIAPRSQRFKILSRKASTAHVAVAFPDFDYDIWMSSPGSITERRKKLLDGMGLDENKELLKMASVAIGRAMTRKFDNAAAKSESAPSSESEVSDSDADSSSVSKVPDSAAPLPPRPRAAPAAPAADSAETAKTAKTAAAPDARPSAAAPDACPSALAPPAAISASEEPKEAVEQKVQNTLQHSVPFVLVRSRSDGDVEADSCKHRKEELIGKTSKQRLTRTLSEICLARPRMCPYAYWTPALPTDDIDLAFSGDQDQPSKRKRGRKLTTVISNTGFGSFFVIKNLDTGKEFIVTSKDPGVDGTWNSLNDLETGKKLTLEEFEKSVGHSPLVKELMRRGRGKNDASKLSSSSYISKSLRMSKKTGAALLKNVKGVASGIFGERERSEGGTKDQNQTTPANLPPVPPPTNNTAEPKEKQNKNDWVKVRQSGKSQKELSALHLCQEFQAHEGCIWTLKFSLNGRYLASAGEDKVIHVWEVQECELTSLTQEEGNLTPLIASSAAPEGAEKKGKTANNQVPQYVHAPETVFSLSEKPLCTFTGHSDDVLDLSWSKTQQLLSSSMDKTVRLWNLESKTCLKVYTHNDYVTCIHFNPVDEDYFISGSLDAKVRIWSVPRRQVVDWTDVHEMVTAVSYTPDGQAALIGTHSGTCCIYSAEESKLTQTSKIDLQQRKGALLKKITGFQFAPGTPSEVLVTSADSRAKIVENAKVVHKFQGFRNANSQIAASLTPNGRYVISASEDSQVYIWRYDRPKVTSGKPRQLVAIRAFESFPCKDVSLAIPWPNTIKGDPSQSLARNTISDPPAKKPPLPNKKTKDDNATTESASVPTDSNSSASLLDDADPKATSQTDGIADSSTSNDSSTKNDDPSATSTSSSSSSSSSATTKSDSNQSATLEYPAWGLVIATASIGGEIRCYQNFGLPRKVSAVGLF